MGKLLVFVLILYSLQTTAQRVPNFMLKDVENTMRTFDELRGDQLTLIDFWASWCKPCLKAIPELNKIYSEYKDKGVKVIGINCDGPRSVAKVSPLSKALQIQYPILLDINSEVMNNLGLSNFPTLLFVNASGEVVYTHEGYNMGDEQSIRKELDKLLAPN